MKIKKFKKLKLYGFNNLTKTLSFNLFDICYTQDCQQSRAYIDYIDEAYSAKRLTKILTNVSNMIGATILNIAKQDYEPQGASVTILISENEKLEEKGTSVVGHLDKSHITVHTYPESHPHEGISTFRADIDVSTCGEISPLQALNFLINIFKPDIASIDYRVRGFTRDVKGKKFFIDHKINSIQNYLAKKIKEDYHMVDINVYQHHIFHTRMLLKKFDLDNYLFYLDKKDLSKGEREKIEKKIKREMMEIFHGKNF